MQHQSRDFRLSDLLRLVSRGKIALPEFQRDFVWDPNQVVELLESVANGWPIGSLLLLEGPQPFGVKNIKGGPDAIRSNVEYYLLDGQQRITSLYHSLTGTGDVVYFTDLHSSDEDTLIRWSKREVFDRTSHSSSVWRLNRLIDDREFESWLAALPSRSVTKYRRIRDERFSQLLRDRYVVPSTVLAEGIELGALTQIFETLNRSGVQLDAFDLMVAVLFPTGFSLRKKWLETLDLDDNYRLFDVEAIELLKLIALWQRKRDQSSARPLRKKVRGVRQNDVLKIPAEEVEADWNRAVGAYGRALLLLKERFGVGNQDAVPSQAMVLVLAYLLDASAPMAYISSWYWKAIASQAYSQGANTQVLTDLDKFDASDYSLPDVPSSIGEVLMEPGRRNKILRLGLRGLMRVSGALDPVTGEPLEPDSVEFSVANGALGPAVTSMDANLISSVHCSPATLRALRKQSRQGREPMQLFSSDALATQGLFTTSFDGVFWPSERVGWIVNRLEDLAK